ncbi:21415_t:CDS:2 [Dentiscutata erythropus]|uniref:Mitochondrial import inner membrane translocase subunit TIM22 n=1 Tax=Dentiscutata erythropus TaxID=1348616 RepID=A0A9N8VFM9_9GLOM|nr:21415_t:CDS:2 [Dentiscutata erythropus]
MAFPNKEPVPKELIYMQMVQDSCIFKTALSGVLGFGLGGLFGMFFSSFDMTPVDPAIYEQPMKQQLKATAKDMAKRTYSTAKNFAIVGAIFSGTECIIEGYRAKNDIYNGVAAGCITGAVLAAKTGPQNALFGCAGFAAFSTAIELYLRRE